MVARAAARVATAGGFRYADVHGGRVDDEATLARIKALAIPPAWTDVWICAQANGHLQATGRDARGRKQYRYHPKWRTARDEVKYERMLKFGDALPAIRHEVDRALKLPGLPREKVLATIVYLLEATMMRVGNEEYARTNKSFGLTTLRNRHVRIDGRDHYLGRRSPDAGSGGRKTSTSHGTMCQGPLRSNRADCGRHRGSDRARRLPGSAARIESSRGTRACGDSCRGGPTRHVGLHLGAAPGRGNRAPGSTTALDG